jgi:hypothetical protein
MTSSRVRNNSNSSAHDIISCKRQKTFQTANHDQRFKSAPEQPKNLAPATALMNNSRQSAVISFIIRTTTTAAHNAEEAQRPCTKLKENKDKKKRKSFFEFRVVLRIMTIVDRQ